MRVVVRGKLDILPRLKTRESHGTAPLDWDIRVQESPTCACGWNPLDKSGTSVYIGAPEEFADWVGYSVEELLEGPAENEDDTNQSDTTDQAHDADESSGFLSRLLGK